MGRGKLTPMLITREKARKTTFDKRKKGMVKKAYELATLCDVKVCLIIYGNDNINHYSHSSTSSSTPTPEIWPHQSEHVRRLIADYEVDRAKNPNSKRCLNLSDFYADRLKTIKYDIQKERQKYNSFILNYSRHHYHYFPRVDELSQDQIYELLTRLDNRIAKVKDYCRGLLTFNNMNKQQSNNNNNIIDCCNQFGIQETCGSTSTNDLVLPKMKMANNYNSFQYPPLLPPSPPPLVVVGQMYHHQLSKDNINPWLHHHDHIGQPSSSKKPVIHSFPLNAFSSGSGQAGCSKTVSFDHDQLNNTSHYYNDNINDTNNCNNSLTMMLFNDDIIHAVAAGYGNSGNYTAMFNTSPPPPPMLEPEAGMLRFSNNPLMAQSYVVNENMVPQQVLPLLDSPSQYSPAMDLFYDQSQGTQMGLVSDFHGDDYQAGIYASQVDMNKYFYDTNDFLMKNEKSMGV